MEILLGIILLIPFLYLLGMCIYMGYNLYKLLKKKE